MIVPRLKDGTFLADVRAANGNPEQLHLWWLGQSGFLVQSHGKHLLLDPYLSDSLTSKYASTDKPHVRLTERVVAPEALDFIDVVTSSHTHTDHLDADTIGLLRIANPNIQLVIPEATRTFVAERLNCPLEYPRGLVAGDSLSLAGFTFHGVPAAHNELECDDKGRHRCIGYVVQCGRWTIYHSGDTRHFAGMEGWLRRFDIDIALLPINGNRAERRVAGNLDGREAAHLAHAINAAVVIPCHYDMFEFNTASPDEFVSTCDRLGQRCVVLACGERWTDTGA